MFRHSRPNILLLMSDEHPVFMTGCYGHKSAKTPHIDALAERGTIFDAASCASPICAPSRAAMMTGRHVSTIEVWDNASPLRSDWPTFAHSFSAAGYRTILCGKMHFVGPDQLHGFDERWTQDIYPATFDWTRSNRARVSVNDGQRIDRVLEAGIGWTRDMDYDEEVIFRSEYGLRQLAKEKDRDPFLLCVSFTGPHYPFKAPKETWDLYDEDDIDLPEIPDDYLEREHPHVKWIRRHGGFDRLVPDDICRKARRATMARITMVDRYIGRLLSLIDELKMADDTLIVYLSDHGDMMGEHGLWFKNAAYDWSSRVPLVFAGPSIPIARNDEAVSLLDLGPTLCSLAGIAPIYEVSEGRDISDLVLGQRPAGQGMAIMENYGEGVWRGWRMIRQGEYKLLYVPGYEPALYDLSEDPNEWQDLAQDESLADVRRSLEENVLEGWEPDRADELRWQSEERRLAILSAKQRLDWQSPSPPVPHPLRSNPNAPINNVDP